ncbi:MAG: YARHG domain-containing protein [Pyrinomonadaceae bacterium]
MTQMCRSILRGAMVVCLLLLVQTSILAAGDGEVIKEWESFDFANQKIELPQIEALSLTDLKFMRGIIFGRHGRVFKDADIGEYLKGRPWFKPNPNFQNSMLNATERDNLDIIREAEARQHEKIEPGDLRFYREQPITESQLGDHTGAEWRVLRAEVEAIHGKRFDDEPWLQNYFEERYWYTAAARYDPKLLSETERKNIETIAAAHKKQRRLALSPGDMEMFQNHALTEEMLRGLGLHELRLLRNEVYARRGRTFGSGWLQQYFDFQPWYVGSESKREPQLSAMEKKNVETIVKYESRLREELSTKAVSQSLLDGLFLEDARKLRNEIYARHGKVFKEKWLQKYFASFDWYKPDPQFSEKSLSQIERKNVAAILAYERDATSVMNAIEG